jgi:hypothetical protein
MIPSVPRYPQSYQRNWLTNKTPRTKPCRQTENLLRPYEPEKHAGNPCGREPDVLDR